MREAVINRVLDGKLIAIVRGIRDKEKCLNLAKAIYDGGIDMLEITFNQSAPDSFADTAAAISAINSHFEGKICVGAGTVLNPEQVKIAADAGAKYIISPDAYSETIKATRAAGLVSIPGVMTPSEIMAAVRAGADFAKVFPTTNLGPAYIKAIRAPLSHVRILGVGGINPQNIPEYLAAGCVGFGVGGNLVNKDWIDAGEFGKITEVAKEFCAALNR